MNSDVNSDTGHVNRILSCVIADRKNTIERHQLCRQAKALAVKTRLTARAVTQALGVQIVIF